MNKVILSGKMAKDLKVIESEKGTIAFGSIIVDRNDNGITDGENGMLVSILFPKNIAQNAIKLLGKGSSVEIDGKVSVGKDYKLSIVANRFQKFADPRHSTKSVKENEKNDNTNDVIICEEEFDDAFDIE